MSFKIICQECGQEGTLDETPDGAVKFEKAAFALTYSNSGGYDIGHDVVELICNRCGNELSLSKQSTYSLVCALTG